MRGAANVAAKREQNPQYRHYNGLTTASNIGLLTPAVDSEYSADCDTQKTAASYLPCCYLSASISHHHFAMTGGLPHASYLQVHRVR